MRATFVAALTAAGFTFASAASDAIVTGTNSGDVSASAWKEIATSPHNKTTSKFTGLDVSKAFPGVPQPGWELSIGVKENVKTSKGNITSTVMSINPPAASNATFDNSWHFCLYAFKVKPASAASYYAGQKDSCSNLVAIECVNELKKQGVKHSSKDGCNSYDVMAKCLRDLDEQSSMTLSVSGKNASSVFGKDSTFFRRVDGTDEKAFQNAAKQPMLVVTVFGSSVSNDKEPTAEAACVIPNAKEKTSGAASVASFMWWAAAPLAVALQLAL